MKGAVMVLGPSMLEHIREHRDRVIAQARALEKRSATLSNPNMIKAIVDADRARLAKRLDEMAGLRSALNGILRRGGPISKREWLVLYNNDILPAGREPEYYCLDAMGFVDPRLPEPYDYNRD